MRGLATRRPGPRALSHHPLPTPCPLSSFHAQAYKAAFAKQSASLKVPRKGVSSLHSVDKAPNPVAGTYATSPYTKSTWPRSMGTNQVFLGQAQ
jgi:hypothetical protein